MNGSFVEELFIEPVTGGRFCDPAPGEILSYHFLEKKYFGGHYMTISTQINVYKNATARGAMLPRVFDLLSISAANQSKLLAALFYDLRNDKLSGDFLRMTEADKMHWMLGQLPTEITSLLTELAAAGK